MPPFPPWYYIILTSVTQNNTASMFSVPLAHITFFAFWFMPTLILRHLFCGLLFAAHGSWPSYRIVSSYQKGKRQR